jgi:hypothetical protein
MDAGAPAATDIIELGHARAYELLMRLGSDMPLWSGVITVQHDYLLRWGALSAANTTATVTQIRAIMNAHARVIWRNRCEIVYSPENKKTQSRTTAEKRSYCGLIGYGSGVQSDGRTNTAHVTKAEGETEATSQGEWKEQTRQPTLQQMKGFKVIIRAQKANKKPAHHAQQHHEQ